MLQVVHATKGSPSFFTWCPGETRARPDGKFDDASAKADEVVWLEPTTLTSETIGKKDIYAFIVELKGP